MVKTIPEAAIQAAAEAIYPNLTGKFYRHDQINPSALRLCREIARTALAAAERTRPARSTFRQRVAERYAYAGLLTAPVYWLILSCTMPARAAAQ